MGGRFSPAKPPEPFLEDDEEGDDDTDVELLQFRNVDTIVAGAGDVRLLLPELPEDGSEHVTWYPNKCGGVPLPTTGWYRNGQLLTIRAFDGQGAGDLYDCRYAYYPGEQEGPAIVSPAEGETISDSTPTITGTGDPGYTMTVSVDGTLVGTTTVDAGGNWSVTVGSALPPGNHTITAEQTGPGDYDQTATSTFASLGPSAATATLRGGVNAGRNNTAGDITSLALPAGTQIGDLIVMRTSANAASNLVVSDPRLASENGTMWLGFATDLSDIQVSALGGFGKRWAIACITLVTNAVGWTSAVHTFDTDISNGETLPIGSVGGVAAAICGIEDTRSTSSGSIGTPIGYTTGQGSPAAQVHVRVDFWTNATVTDSPETTALYDTGSHGTAQADVIGLIGP